MILVNGIKTEFIRNEKESLVYNAAKIGISVSNFNMERYYSDRLLRIMACGTLPMSHEFKGWEKDFRDGENIVIFKDMKDLVDKCNYYLDNNLQRLRIAENAYRNVHENCTWKVRMDELNLLLSRY